ncbi:MAG: hypothetical protein P9M14_01505 [Candidatus Alcyoniella australis]|nr:hypothetical protein [Candidatus Alcyoniella australis]
MQSNTKNSSQRSLLSRLVSTLIVTLMALLLIAWLVLGESKAQISGQFQSADYESLAAAMLDPATFANLDSGFDGIDADVIETLYSLDDPALSERLYLLSIVTNLGVVHGQSTALLLCSVSTGEAEQAVVCKVPDVRDLARRNLSFKSDQRVTEAYRGALRGLDLEFRCPAEVPCGYQIEARVKTWLPKGMARGLVIDEFKAVISALDQSEP